MDDNIEQLVNNLQNEGNENSNGILSQLQEYINDLINNNFNGLIQLLYKLDIDEAKLKAKLNTTHEDPASIIASIIIQRVAAKQKFKKNSLRDPNVPKEDQW